MFNVISNGKDMVLEISKRKVYLAKEVILVDCSIDQKRDYIDAIKFGDFESIKMLRPVEPKIILTLLVNKSIEVISSKDKAIKSLFNNKEIVKSIEEVRKSPNIRKFRFVD